MITEVILTVIVFIIFSSLISTIRIIAKQIFNSISSIIKKKTPETTEEYNQPLTFDNLDTTKTILVVFSIPIMIACIIIILINGFKGITDLLNDYFNIDTYKYINILDIDFKSNLEKIYIPEIIINILGLIILCIFLYYINNLKKFYQNNLQLNSAQNSTLNPTPNLTNYSTPNQITNLAPNPISNSGLDSILNTSLSSLI